MSSSRRTRQRTSRIPPHERNSKLAWSIRIRAALSQAERHAILACCRPRIRDAQAPKWEAQIPEGLGLGWREVTGVHLRYTWVRVWFPVQASVTTLPSALPRFPSANRAASSAVLRDSHGTVEARMSHRDSQGRSDRRDRLQAKRAGGSAGRRAEAHHRRAESASRRGVSRSEARWPLPDLGCPACLCDLTRSAVREYGRPTHRQFSHRDTAGVAVAAIHIP